MSIVLDKHVSNFGQNTFDTSGATRDTTGDTLFVVGRGGYDLGTGHPGTISDSKSNAYTDLTEYGVSTGAMARLAHSVAPVTDAAHFWTDTGATIFEMMGVLTFTGTDLSSPIDGAGDGLYGNSGSSNQVATGITLSADDEAVVSYLCIGQSFSGLDIDWGFGSETATIFETVTYSPGVTLGGALACRIFSGGSGLTIKPTWTWTGSGFHCSAMLAIKSSGGAPAVRRYPFVNRAQRPYPFRPGVPR